MATRSSTNIGNLVKTKDGFEGELSMLSFSGNIRAYPIAKKENQNAPDYIVEAMGIEIGTIKLQKKKHGSGTYFGLKLTHFQITGSGENDIYANLAASKKDENQFYLLVS